MKLGVICDGISRDLAHAVEVMDEFDLEYAELQFVGDKEVGDHSKQEIAEMKALLHGRGKPVSCLSRHIFAGMTTANRPGDDRDLALEASGGIGHGIESGQVPCDGPGCGGSDQPKMASRTSSSSISRPR